MKVLVTGPTGLLGNNLVRELLKNDRYEIYAFVHSNRSRVKLEGLPVNIVLGDIMDADKVSEAIEGMDVVFHCAASTKIYPPKDPKIYSVNIQGTRNVIEACIRNNTNRLIYVGTANSFGFSENPNEIRNEGSVYNSNQIGMGYMDSKKKAQDEVLEAVRERNLNAVIVNPTGIMGPYDHLPSSGQIVLALHRGKIPGYTDGGKNLIHVRDVCQAMINAVTMGGIGECYILGNQNLTYAQIFQMISKELNVAPPGFKFPKWLIILYGRINSFLARTFGYKPIVSREVAITSTKFLFYDSSKALRDLKLKQTNIQEAVRECNDWFKQKGLL